MSMLPVKQYSSLRQVVDLMFREAKGRGYSNRRLAAEAGLGATTVDRLLSYETMYPRLQTVYLIAAVLGLRVVSVPSNGQAKKKAG